MTSKFIKYYFSLILLLFLNITTAQTQHFFPEESENNDLNTSTHFQGLLDGIAPDEQATITIVNIVNLDASHTIPSNVHLKFRKGGYIEGSGTLIINSSLEAGLFKIFDESITLDGNVQSAYVYPQWFGAISNDDIPDDAAINKAINFSSHTYKKAVFIPSGSYILSESLILTENASIIGENLRGTILKTTENFSDTTMIKTSTDSYYNNIENFTLENLSDSENLVMIHTYQQWEGSYIKNIHLKNDYTIKGGIWHTKGNGGSKNQDGGQYVVENINAFYGKGICTNEFIKLINAGGLYCKKWNINSKNATNHTGPFVHLEVATLILDASDIHIETSPGNNTPSIKLVGNSSSSLNLRNSDIVPYEGETFSGDLVGIEIDVTNDIYNSAEWNIENVILKSGTGGKWYVDYKVPIRLKYFKNDEIITKDITNFENTDSRNYTAIRKYTKTELSLNKHPVDPRFQNAIGIKESVINQQTIGTLNVGDSEKILTPHMMLNSPRQNSLDAYTLSTGNNYQAKGYWIFISAMDNWGVPKGGLYQVLTTFYEGTLRFNILPLSDNTSTGLDLTVDNNNQLILTNNSPRRLTRTNLLILGTGTEKQ